MEKVVIAGDPYQSINSYMGGSPKFFLEEPGTLKLLGSTHRLSRCSWEASRRILRNIGVKIPELQTQKEGVYPTRVSIEGFIDKIDSDKKVFLLCRTNFFASQIKKKLRDEGFIFYGPGGWTDKMAPLFNALSLLRGHIPLISRKEWLEFLEALRKENVVGLKKEVGKLIPDTEETLTLERALDCIPLLLHTEFKAKYFNPGNFVKKALSEHQFKLIKTALEKYKNGAPPGRVTVGTIHSSKGREADDVFVFDALTRRVSERLKNREGAEEEARIFYVASTRHRDRLLVVECNGEGYRYPLSRILIEEFKDPTPGGC
jgi:hypothetical protein